MIKIIIAEKYRICKMPFCLKNVEKAD